MRLRWCVGILAYKLIYTVQSVIPMFMIMLMCYDFGTSVDIRHFCISIKTFYGHGIQEAFEVRKQICDASALDQLPICM